MSNTDRIARLSGALTRRSILGGLAVLPLGGCGTSHSSAARIRLRSATDVSSRHILSLTIRRFLDGLESAFPGELDCKIFDAGKLFYDRDMPRAVYRGDLDFAAPAITGLARLVPNCGLTSLPPFYGQPAELTQTMTDGAFGARLASEIESKIGGKVLQPFADLGFVDLFCTDARRAATGATGQKVRIPSGATNVLRLRALGAEPVMMPFSDVPLGLSQGVVDAVETTAETVRTTQLWDAGLTACLRTRALFQQYVPIVSERFWAGARQNLRDAIVHFWSEAAIWARGASAQRQESARAACTANGIAMIEPAPQLIAEERGILLPKSAAIAEKVGIDPLLLSEILKGVER